ncbi:MAG TPA: hypothetical protein VKY24_00555 [Reyranella sp.]|nr:hypothetical protein [Reyranella sp.]
MQRRTKRHAKNQTTNGANGKKRPQTGNGMGLWINKPGENLSGLLSRVRAAQVMRLHFR